jgi:hypothetical protein
VFRASLGALAIAVAVWSRPAAADVRDGNALLRQCTATIGAIRNFCYGYIDAVADYLFQGRTMGTLSACVPQAPGDVELRVVVVDYLRENPGLRYLSAAELIARALAARFPCQ